MRKILLIGISTFALGVAAMATAQQQLASKDETYRMETVFGDVLTMVDQQYVVPVDNKKLIEAALDGMLTSLDPHSGYLDAAGFSDLSDQTRAGDYGGLGIQLGGEDGAIKIVAPMDGTPAARAHLTAGDYITAINGESIIGQNINDAIKQMRGPVGTRRHPDHRPRQTGPLHRQTHARGDRGEVGVASDARRLRLCARGGLRREDRPGDHHRHPVAESGKPAHERDDPRPAQQSGRPGQSGRRGGLRLSRRAAKSSASVVATPAISSATTHARMAIWSEGCLWWCWSTTVRPRRPRSSPVR